MVLAAAILLDFALWMNLFGILLLLVYINYFSRGGGDLLMLKRVLGCATIYFPAAAILFFIGLRHKDKP